MTNHLATDTDSTRPRSFPTRRHLAIGGGLLLAGALLAASCGGSSAERTLDASAAPRGTSAPATAAAGSRPDAPQAPRLGDAQARTAADARQAWDRHAGRSYVLVFDIDSEGLDGLHCVEGTVGDPGHARDLAGLGAGGPRCETEAQMFHQPTVAVETLLDWAEQVERDGGSVSFDDNGVPTRIDIDHAQVGFHLEVITFAFNATSGEDRTDGANEAEESRASLDEAMARWTAAAPPEYVWIGTWSAEGMTDTVCIDHTPTDDIATAVDDAGCVVGPTVPEVFGRIGEALAEGASVDAFYSPVDGHPVQVTVVHPSVDGWTMQEISYDVPE